MTNENLLKRFLESIAPRSPLYGAVAPPAPLHVNIEHAIGGMLGQLPFGPIQGLDQKLESLARRSAPGSAVSDALTYTWRR